MNRTDPRPAIQTVDVQFESLPDRKCFLTKVAHTPDGAAAPEVTSALHTRLYLAGRRSAHCARPVVKSNHPNQLWTAGGQDASHHGGQINRPPAAQTVK